MYYYFANISKKNLINFNHVDVGGVDFSTFVTKKESAAILTLSFNLPHRFSLDPI